MLRDGIVVLRTTMPSLSIPHVSKGLAHALGKTTRRRGDTRATAFGRRGARDLRRGAVGRRDRRARPRDRVDGSRDENRREAQTDQVGPDYSPRGTSAKSSERERAN